MMPRSARMRLATTRSSMAAATETGAWASAGAAVSTNTMALHAMQPIMESSLNSAPHRQRHHHQSNRGPAPGTKCPGAAVQRNALAPVEHQIQRRCVALQRGTPVALVMMPLPQFVQIGSPDSPAHAGREPAPDLIRGRLASGAL